MGAAWSWSQGLPSVTEGLVKVAAIVAVIAVSLLAGRVARRRSARRPRIDAGGLGLPPGLVVFTSTDCPNCREVLGMLRKFSAPVRDVTYELEPALFESAGVDGVPTLLVRARNGVTVAQFAGVPARRALSRAVRLAGW